MLVRLTIITKTFERVVTMKKAIIILVSLMLIVSLMAGCGAPMADLESSRAPAPAPESPTASDPAPAAPMELAPESPMHEPAPSLDSAPAQQSPAVADGGFDQGAFEPNETIGPLPILTPSQAGGRLLSYNVTLHLQTKDFIPAIRLLLNSTAEKGGYLENADVRGRDMRENTTERSADFLLQVPSERLTEFIIIIEDNYNILRLQQSMNEHTAEYRQVETSLNHLYELEERLIEDIQDEEITDQQRRALEWELVEVRSWINDFIAQQTEIDHSVMYSRVTVQLREVVIVEEVEEEEEEEVEEEEPPVSYSERLSERISISVDVFVAFCQGLLLAIVALAPVLLILLFFLSSALIIVRVVKKRKTAKSKAVDAYYEEKRDPGE